MTVLLDTSVLIDILNGRRQRLEFVRTLMEAGHSLAGCAVTIAEVHAGMLPAEAKATGELLDGLAYFATHRTTAQRAGDLKAFWKKKGHALGLSDVLIAAVAIEYGLTLATDNIKHFPMPELKLLPLPALH